MQYARMPPPERRDSNLDSNGSTPFQTHQGLGQALGSHLPGLSQNGGPQGHPGPQSSHSPLFSVAPSHTSPALKRKQIDPGISTQVLKRRRDAEDMDNFDVDGTSQGAKHWTDDEKSKLFSWLMGPGQDEHWNALRATKNSCLRECAIEVFGSKKTYQALKGCYERNFNLFKQIYAFESFHAHSGDVSSMAEADRLREYERRLQIARKAGCDVGNVTARTIDHWHRVGWYELFYRRWHGDPATTRPVQARAPTAGGSNTNGGDNTPEMEDEPQMNISDPVMMSNAAYHQELHRGPNQLVFVHPNSLRDPIAGPPPSISPIAGSSGSGQQQTFSSGNGTPAAGASPSSTMPHPDQAAINLTITHGMTQMFQQFLQMQTHTGKAKLEYLKRKEEREERESAQRREGERLKMEREAAEFEYNKQKIIIQQKTERALQLLENPAVDASIKQAAGDFLKKLFTAD